MWERHHGCHMDALWEWIDRVCGNVIMVATWILCGHGRSLWERYQGCHMDALIWTLSGLENRLFEKRPYYSPPPPLHVRVCRQGQGFPGLTRRKAWDPLHSRYQQQQQQRRQQPKRQLQHNTTTTANNNNHNHDNNNNNNNNTITSITATTTILVAAAAATIWMNMMIKIWPKTPSF